MKELVKKLCKEKGVSMNTAETEMGLAKGYISKLENHNPNQKTLQKMSDYFGVSMDYLLGREKDKQYYLNEETAHAAQEIFENKELKALFDVQRDMNPDDLKALHSMALALKRKERGDMDDTGC